MRRSSSLAIALLLAIAAPAMARDHRELRSFQREHPCPSTGQRRGSCPGYVIDHVRPLCAGGPDHRSNMQWQTREASLEKDKEERRDCRARK